MAAREMQVEVLGEAVRGALETLRKAGLDDVALWAVASCGALPFALLGYVAFKAFEKSRTPPKRTKDKKAKKAKKAD